MTAAAASLDKESGAVEFISDTTSESRTMQLVTLTFVVLIAGQAPSVPPDLQKAIEARRAAQASADIETWNRHTADDFIVVDTDGVVKNKAQRGADIKAGAGPGAKFTEERIRMYGDTAVVTNLQENLRFTSVWVRQSGVWRMVSAHSPSSEVIEGVPLMTLATALSLSRTQRRRAT